jgi:hypothetical protein
MSVKASVGFVAAGLLALGAMAGPPARAATLAVVPGFAGTTPSSVPGCPYIVWRLASHETSATSTTITGIAYYSDLSGLSNVTGTGDPSTGHFQLTLSKTSIGNGPVGTVDGTRAKDGAITAKLTGEGCANNDVHIMPMENLNAYTNFYGGGSR